MFIHVLDLVSAESWSFLVQKLRQIHKNNVIHTFLADFGKVVCIGGGKSRRPTGAQLYNVAPLTTEYEDGRPGR